MMIGRLRDQGVSLGTGLAQKIDVNLDLAIVRFAPADPMMT